ncbi:MAG: tetratricopeptide repeat protein [Sedimentisphaerales bacterium]
MKQRRRKIETLADKPAVKTTSRLTLFLQSPAIIAIAIAVITSAVFIRVLSADFVMWDDDLFIYENPTLGGLTLENLRLIFTNVTFSSTWYTPLTGLRWCITYQFCRLNPLGYHLGNLFLHAADAVLVFWTIRKLLILGLPRTAVEKPTRISVCAALGALLWSLHPLRAEAVCWAANAYGQALLFLLISLLCYLRANEAKTTAGHWLLITVSLVSFAASLLSGPFGLGFLPVLFILDIYPLGRLGKDKRWWKSANARIALLEKTPFLGVTVAVTLIDIIVKVISPVGAHDLVSLAEFGLTARLWQAIYIWAYYIWRPWYPVNLSPVYTILVTFKPFSVFIFSAILLIGTIKSAMVLQRRWPLGITLVMCYLSLLIPVLGIFEHPYYPCDRYSLIVSILWSVLLAAWLIYLKTETFLFKISIVLSVIIITVLGFLTYKQTQVWTNSKTLFTHMLKTLGNDPYTNDIYWRLGTVYALEGNIDEGIKYCTKAVEIEPANLNAQNALGSMLIRKNKPEEALGHFNVALLIDPSDAVVYLNKIKALLMLNRFGEAINHLDNFLQQKHDSAEGNYLLSVALEKTGKTSQAVTQLKKTIMLAPNIVEPINDLARILATSQNLSLRDPNEAIRLATRGCELTNYQDIDLLDTLAVAYASGGKFSEAVNYAKEALSLANLSSQTVLIEKIQGHLDLFQHGRACSE